ncbi:uncharacterized protein LOC144198842 isoform X2 [Stigmatopora nigra]
MRPSFSLLDADLHRMNEGWLAFAAPRSVMVQRQQQRDHLSSQGSQRMREPIPANYRQQVGDTLNFLQANHRTLNVSSGTFKLCSITQKDAEECAMNRSDV